MHFETMLNDTKFIFIMSNEDIYVTSNLGAFIFKSMKIREMEMV